jgi:aminocarboxymuconate-semialdehyde decarboxylase
MYYDTITWGQAQLRFLIDQVGADRVVLGSDYPTKMGPDSPRDWVGAMSTITDDERELIYHGNLERWLGI